MEVVDDLRKQPRPVHRIHRPELESALERQIVEYRFHDALAIVEAAFDGETMYVLARRRGHLARLQRARPPVRIQHKDVDIRALPDTGDGGAARIATGSAKDVQTSAPRSQDVLEHSPQHLQRHVLESQRGTVEQFQHMQIADLHKGGDVRMPKRCEGVRDNSFQHVAPHIAREFVEQLDRQFSERETAPVFEPSAEVGDPFGQ